MSVPSRVRQVVVHPLPALPQHSANILPEWAQPAIRTPIAQPWPENQNRFVIGVVDDLGNTGWFGPVSASVAAIIRDQIMPWAMGVEVRAWRSAATIRPQGRHRSGSHVRLAISAVELALWDLRSRILNLAIGDLIGGRARTVVPAYATALGIDIDHPVAPEVASWLVEEGFWGQKWRLPGYDRGEPPQADARRLERLRIAIGDAARLCVDAGKRWNTGYARQMLPVLAEHQVTWIEEPGMVSDNDLARFGLVHAAGEHDYDSDDQLLTLTCGTVQAWQPDPSWNGGLAHSVRMVELAAALGIPCFPHGSNLPAALHLASLMPSEAIPAVEYHLSLEPLRQAVYTVPLIPDRGAFALTDRPGLAAPYRLDETNVPGSHHAA
ncbi:MAG: mandelate racemase/muconate lactonizing enzyme family protein [Nocardiopsaceae bacterium]|nr:mandelate racemase/muconate lactonizing enzyme family protein [Nocardiopsaceae bacterium]